MINLNKFNKRDKKLQEIIGVKYHESLFFDDTDIYSCYYNPSTGVLTGIMDNERDNFYRINQTELIEFVRTVNIRELRFSEFMKKIELEFKQHIDRNLEYMEWINTLEDKNEELEKLLDDKIEELEKLLEEDDS